MYNIYRELNKVIDYIEDNIMEDIDISYLAHLAGLNTSMLKNIFSCLTGISIQEYIRYRRLSLATKEILNGESATNVAMKYHYSTLSSFTRSYKNFSGFAPKEIKKKGSLHLFNRITFKENVENYDLKYRIENVEFNLYGVSKEISYHDSFKYTKPFWEEVKKKYPIFNERIRYGLLYDMKDSCRYYCLLEEKFSDAEEIKLPKRKYFIYRINNESARVITDKIFKGIEEYVESLNYSYADAPVVERYEGEFVDIYIPIT